MIDGRITAVEAQQRRGGRRSNVFVDGRYAFSLNSDAAASLRIGDPVSKDRTADLLWQDERARCYEAAVRFLAARPRSERELRQRLGRHRFPVDLIDQAVEKLQTLGLLDDSAFAAYWVDQRQTHRPRGMRLLNLELRQKGVSAEDASDAMEQVGDQADAAYRAAARRAEGMRALDERAFRQRLGAFLQRRGFDYDTIRSTVRRLWDDTR